MVFFKNKTIFIKNTNESHSVNIQPMTNKLRLDTFGDIKSDKIMFIDTKCEEGWIVILEGDEYVIEKSLQWDNYSECALLKYK